MLCVVSPAEAPDLPFFVVAFIKNNVSSAAWSSVGESNYMFPAVLVPSHRRVVCGISLIEFIFGSRALWWPGLWMFGANHELDAATLHTQICHLYRAHFPLNLSKLNGSRPGSSKCKRQGQTKTLHLRERMLYMLHLPERAFSVENIFMTCHPNIGNLFNRKGPSRMLQPANCFRPQTPHVADVRAPSAAKQDEDC